MEISNYYYEIMVPYQSEIFKGKQEIPHFLVRCNFKTTRQPGNLATRKVEGHNYILSP